MMVECIFCKIIGGEIPSYKVYEDEETLAFLDINPITRGHTLVVSKEHVPNFSRAGEGVVASVAQTANRVARGLKEAFQPLGFNYVVNEGKMAGQLVDHLHVHITPRYREGEMEFRASRAELEDEELKAIAEKVGSNL